MTAAVAGVRIACRLIAEEDEGAVIALLSRGFGRRGAEADHWFRAMAALRTRRVPPACPRYGYCLTAGREIVGVLLLIFSDHDGPGRLRCAVSSWYVEPDYRFYASTLSRAACRRHGCTYVNTSSEAHTRPALRAQGYRCYAEGQVLCVPALSPRRAGVTVRRVRTAADAADSAHRQLLAEHAARGCISLCCAVGSRTHPFVFLRRRLPRIGLPCAQLVFCESVASFVDLHADLGRYLLRLGLFVAMFDAVGPVAGVPGRYLPGRMPKYALGPEPPRLGDLAYGEDVLFGLAGGG